MANTEQLSILTGDVETWNVWRIVNDGLRPDLRKANLWKANLRRADLTEADLAEADLRGGVDLAEANLSMADLRNAHLTEVNLTEANLYSANLFQADLRNAQLTEANLREASLGAALLTRADLTRANLQGAILVEAELQGANLEGANLRGADLQWANLQGANLNQTDLSGADLRWADLRYAALVGTDLTRAELADCKVYGASVWDVQLVEATQTNLSINRPGDPTITVDNLKVAQFLYLMLHNGEIRDIIDTLTSKVVLILGRFTPERKAVLDALREALRQRNYVPVLFDFEGPLSLNFTETVTLLARMARFILADLTDPASIPQELQAIVPHVAVPVQPLIARDARPFSMFHDYQLFPWALPICRYASLEDLLSRFQDEVIAPIEAKVIDVRALKQPLSK